MGRTVAQSAWSLMASWELADNRLFFTIIDNHQARVLVRMAPNPTSTGRAGDAFYLASVGAARRLPYSLGRLFSDGIPSRTISLVLAIGLPALVLAAVLHGIFRYTAPDPPHHSLSWVGSLAYAGCLAPASDCWFLPSLNHCDRLRACHVPSCRSSSIRSAILVSCFNGAAFDMRLTRRSTGRADSWLLLGERPAGAPVTLIVRPHQSAAHASVRSHGHLPSVGRGTRSPASRLAHGRISSSGGAAMTKPPAASKNSMSTFREFLMPQASARTLGWSS